MLPTHRKRGETTTVHMATQCFPSDLLSPTIPQSHTAPPEVLGIFGSLGAQFQRSARKQVNSVFTWFLAQNGPFWCCRSYRHPSRPGRTGFLKTCRSCAGSCLKPFSHHPSAVGHVFGLGGRRFFHRTSFCLEAGEMSFRVDFGPELAVFALPQLPAPVPDPAGRVFSKRAGVVPGHA